MTSQTKIAANNASFKDHFSHDSAAYSSHRPGYPDSLFSFLSSITKKHDLAWDCATGSGQSAIRLAESFNTVLATDASKAQINNARKHKKVHYYVAAAENAAIKSSSVDLITVAQAIHWFDFDAFSSEVERTLKPSGILAIWSYNLLSISPDIDRHIRHLYGNILKPYWPAERSHVESGYKSINFPLKELSTPAFHMSLEWTQAQLISYLSTWSAVNTYIEKNNQNPVDIIQDELIRLCENEKTAQMSIKWPLTVRAWQKKD